MQQGEYIEVVEMQCVTCTLLLLTSITGTLVHKALFSDHRLFSAISKSMKQKET